MVDEPDTTVDLRRGGGVSPPAHTDTPEAPHSLPERIGSFRIIDRLGKGGMGVVYLAEQTEPVRRRVAVKVIATALHDREGMLRFAAERQAMARLSHPNVAQILEAGTTTEGHPYFAMELVEGVAISTYCDQKQLSIRERLELFCAVCDGVQHAHQKGILHRDLKPSNVLVAESGRRPVPKIIDFGIAKAIDQPLVEGTLLTGNRVIGTPAFLAPEALDGGHDIDTRSDVYSLGVLLYELLVGILPYDFGGDSFLKIVGRMINEEPTPPSSRWRALDGDTRRQVAELRGLDAAAMLRRLLGDLDWIVLKAIVKERQDRYGSPSELAADIGRYLRHEPIEARPRTTWYQLIKFVRRRLAVVAAVLLLFLSLIAGVVARTIEARKARLALMENQELSRFLVDLFEVSDPEEARGESITARELLDRASRELGSGLHGQPLARARFLQTVGTIYHKLGLYSQARPLLEQSLEIRRNHLPERHVEVADSLHALGELALAEGQLSEAASLLGESLDIREHTLGSSHPSVATTLDALAALANNRADYDKAERLYQHSLAIRRQTLGASHPDVAMSVQSLAATYWRAGRYAEAEPLYRQALMILEQALGNDHPDVAQTLDNLGTLLSSQGRFDEAREQFRRALAIREKVLGSDHPDVAESLQSLGILCRRQGDHQGAEQLYRRALDVRERTLGEHHLLTATTLTNLGTVCLLQNRFEEAESYLRRALDIRERGFGPDHPKVALTLSNLGTLYMAQEKLSQAEQLYRRALAIKEQALGPDHLSVAYTLHAIAEICLEQQRYQEAEQLLKRALAIREPVLAPEHPDLQVNLRSYHGLLLATGRDAEAAQIAARLPERDGEPEQ